jgi:hypothetical protein
MPRLIAAATLFVLLAATGLLSSADHGVAADAVAVKPGATAPGFTAPDITGRMVNPGQFAGQIVILEWTNDGCPFVQKHYDSGNMQSLQRRYTREGNIWLTVASSAPGEEGYVTPAAAKTDLARWQAAPTHYLLDPGGVVGRLYDARATPHMVVIDKSGKIAYMGAIDDTPSTRLADVKTAKNYLVAALDEIAAGKPVTTAATRAYGCSIKYKTS